MPYTFPSALQQRYFQINAHRIDGSSIGPVRVSKYRNNSHGDPDTSAKAGLALKDKIIGALRSRYKKVIGKTQSGDWIDIPAEKQPEWFEGLRFRPIQKSAIVRAFVGKGSLEDIQLALDAGIATDKIDTDLVSIQKVCDDCIGLDCNGFVGNYFKQLGMVGSDGHYNANTDPSTFAARGIKRTAVAEVVKDDVLLWPGSPQHIAVVDYVWGFGNMFSVTESASSLGGLHTRWYQFTGKTSYGDSQVKGGGKGTMFEVQRPTASGGYSRKWVLICKVG